LKNVGHFAAQIFVALSPWPNGWRRPQLGEVDELVVVGERNREQFVSQAARSTQQLDRGLEVADRLALHLGLACGPRPVAQVVGLVDDDGDAERALPVGDTLVTGCHRQSALADCLSGIGLVLLADRHPDIRPSTREGSVIVDPLAYERDRAHSELRE
jgi:hypothetical protein